MSGYNRVIELAASYNIAASGDRADVELESNQARGVTLTLLHERLVGDTKGYDLAGHAQLRVTLISSESLTVIARHKNHIIGALVSEVVCCESSRLLLHPKGGYNLIIYQNRLDSDDDRQMTAARPGVYEASLIKQNTTQALGALLTATVGHYAGTLDGLPEDLKLIYPTLDQALDLCDESFSWEMLASFCTILEVLGVHTQAGIARQYKDAQAVLRMPAKAAQL